MPYDATRDQHAKRRTPSSPRNASTPKRRAVAVATNNNADLSEYASALYIGVGGDVVCIPVGNADDAPVTFKNVPQGSILPVQVRRVKATSTTATNILALYD